MARKNFGVGIGRPPAPPAAKMGKPMRAKGMSAAPMGAAPSDGFRPALPAAAFKTGGKVGYQCMPRHHDTAGFYGGYDPRKK